ncbi:hypothetical protein N780_15515 [Pontibacillus chungwhensis BH030062]|uniref:Uncharacterized protein n=1 Tax=Pontibacillus chungwhensis BH030062 TaxID=1385513 RepID=A0A0A2UZK6_9BACI|nr:hypothetical protein [Pontibacillus chungwhensis]KGP91986.1 hypothetical protein N780_15515 [Pontibacillus chungwhensis BH030062]
MNVIFILLIGFIMTVLLSFLFYKLSRNKSHWLMKYIPSITAALSIGIVYMKMLFLSQSYEPITDIVLMIILSLVFGVSLLSAILIDVVRRKV